MESTDEEFGRPAGERFFKSVPEARWIVTFQIFNALSFQMVLGAPMILMTRGWGASPSYIGALSAMIPFFSMLQIFAGPRADHIGYRRMFMMGWMMRTVFLAGVAMLPFIAHMNGLSDRHLLILLFLMMLGFNVVRGFAVAAWTPWMAVIIPNGWRGRYLSLEQLAVNASGVIVLLSGGLMIGENPTDLRYGLLFLGALIAAVFSLFAISRVNAPPARERPAIKEKMHHWVRRVWRYRRMRRLIRVHVCFYLAMAGGSGFVILYLRNELNYSDQVVMWMGMVQTIGAIMSAQLWGPVADRHGSRPVIQLGCGLLVAVWSVWVLMALGLLASTTLLIYVMHLMAGAGMVGFIVGMTRYNLNNAPEKDRTLALTLYSVAGSAAAGLAPLFWGMVIDGLGGWSLRRWGLHWHAYSVYFFVTAIILCGCMLLINRIPVKRVVKPGVVIYHMFIDMPFRTVVSMGRFMRRDREDGGEV